MANDQANAEPPVVAPDSPAAPGQTPFSWLTSELYGGLNDWISLLGGPDPEVFKPSTNFEWPILLRLIVIVLSFTGAILGSVLVVFHGKLGDVVFQKVPAAVLLMGAILAVFYTFSASVFGVQITMKNAFFTILLLSLPWISLTVALHAWVGASARANRWAWMGPIWLAWVWLVPIYLSRNLCRGISMLNPACRKWRVCLSVILPVTFLIGLFILVTLFVDMD
jgi:hypothetical protein